jgi:predicted nucleic acid-binding Zn ribbon protein
MDDPEFRPAGDVLKELFEKMLPASSEGYGRLFGGWNRIVGEEMAFHAAPKDVVRGSLVVETDHPGWKQRLLMEKERILAVLARQYPELEIRKLRVVLTRGKLPRREVDPSPAKPETLPGEEDEISVVETVPDGEFLDLLERMKRYGDS